MLYTFAPGQAMITTDSSAIAAYWIGNLVFSGIGFVAFVYGKKQTQWRAMAIGIALMTYPYFVPSTIILYVVGFMLTAALFAFRE